MNKRDFFNWLRDQNCEIKPKEGLNNTAPTFEVFNRARPEKYCYFVLASHSDMVSNHTIEKCILHLAIDPPAQNK